MIRDITNEDAEVYYRLGSLINAKFAELNNIKEKLDSPVIVIKAFEDEGIVKGFIEVEDLGIETNVTNIVVDPNYRRQHIGDMLILDLINNTKSKTINLEVSVENKPAVKLYLKHGFVEKGIRKGYYNGVDAITMVKEL